MNLRIVKYSEKQSVERLANETGKIANGNIILQNGASWNVLTLSRPRNHLRVCDGLSSSAYGANATLKGTFGGWASGSSCQIDLVN